jgi:hypothetical protein
VKIPFEIDVNTFSWPGVLYQFMIYSDELDVWDIKVLLFCTGWQGSHLSVLSRFNDTDRKHLIESIEKLMNEGIVIIENDRIDVNQKWLDQFRPSNAVINGSPDISRVTSQSEKHKVSKHGGYVYIISYGDKVKIGRSINPESRLKSLQKMSFDLLDMIYCENETADINESVLHERFSADRLKGEFFNYTPDIKQFITERVGYVK